MQSHHRSSSKGKGKARDKDRGYEQSFASLSLSDCGDPLAPRSDCYGSSYTNPYGSSYEHPYPGNDHYSWTPQSSHGPVQSSSAAYGGAPGHSSQYPASSATSSIGGYEYQSEPSGASNHDEFTGYDSASVTSSSAYGGDSAAGWSDLKSCGTAPSSAPSMRSNRTDVNNTINRQRPPNERYQLPCEFYNLTGCDRVFPGDEVQEWMNHVEGHLKSKFPTKLKCWFCSEYRFDAREVAGGDVRSNFIARMEHIRNHLVYDNSRPEQMQKDGHLVKHLIDNNLVERGTYESIVNLTTVPPIPGSQVSKDRHRSHQSHHSHHRLPQVEEEVVAESSSRHHHRREHDRDRGQKHKHRK